MPNGQKPPGTGGGSSAASAVPGYADDNRSIDDLQAEIDHLQSIIEWKRAHEDAGAGA